MSSRSSTPPLTAYPPNRPKTFYTAARDGSRSPHARLRRKAEALVSLQSTLGVRPEHERWRWRRSLLLPSGEAEASRGRARPQLAFGDLTHTETWALLYGQTWATIVPVPACPRLGAYPELVLTIKTFGALPEIVFPRFGDRARGYDRHEARYRARRLGARRACPPIAAVGWVVECCWRTP